MAPIAVETPPQAKDIAVHIKKNQSVYKEQSGGVVEYNHKAETEGDGEHGAAKYQNYLPTWNPDEKYPPLETFTHVEHGRDADPALPVFYNDRVQIEDMTPATGSAIKGVQLSQLSAKGKDQLALLVARRKVVIFRDQDFADLPIDKALDWGGYFGRHHIHPTSGAPKGHPEIHLVHRGVNDPTSKQLLADRLHTVAWHSDVTYEQQPPGTTFLYIFDKPSSGGDTIFADGVEAYRRLSPALRERLHGLKAVHSGIEQADLAKGRGSIVRREPVTSVHPVVRTHPATGEKAVFVNQQCRFHL
jgi:sulfonate dioxygenase